MQRSSWPSEPRQLRVRQRSVSDVHLSVLRAAPQRGDGLAGVEQPIRVECLLDAEERRSLLRRELHAHGVDLLDPDPVLPGDRSAELHAQLEDLRPETIRALPLAAAVGIEQDQRMQVAVAGMEY